MRILLLGTLCGALLCGQQTPAWVTRSNENTKILLDVLAKYAPESAGQIGVAGLDQEITVPSIDLPARARRDTAEARKTFESRLASEKDPLVKQDLEILIQACDQQIHSSEAYEKALLPSDNVAATIFSGMHGLLDDQISAERRPAAVVRLKKYTGMEEGYAPTTVLAEKVFRKRTKNPALLGPAKAEVEKDLSEMHEYSTGIGLLLEKYKMTGYAPAYAKLRDQLGEYEQFVRTEVLPKSRSDFRLPPEIYQVNLENVGVDYSTEDLTRLAHSAFTEIQGEMRPLADKIAQEHHLPSSDYRDVVRWLKTEQIPADQTMAVYHQTLADIETIIRRENIITLPNRPCIVRIATAAETAQQPAPHMRPPPLLNNHGERGEFVLPGGTTGAGGKALKYDDFTFNAATWTLTAHEARPGHELQFDAMVERGVSQARGIFAFNSVNVEGWGLYSEWVMFPYMPDDAKLISLQLRLLRAARAYLDPELQQGKIAPAQAMQVLEKDVVLSEAFATEEVDRFTFRSPGQAVSYFDGYLRMRALRTDTEKAMGEKFNQRKFHDFILDQGMLPPNVLRKAVMAEYVGGGN